MASRLRAQLRRLRRNRLARARRGLRHDVVFYMPGLGPVLSAADSAPAGGAETQVLMLAKALAKQGASIAIIAYARAADLPAEVEGVRIVSLFPFAKRARFVGKFAEALVICRALWLAPSRTVVARCAGTQVGWVALYARLAGRRMVYASAGVADFDAVQFLPRRRERFLFELGVRLANAIVVQTSEQVELCERSFKRIPVMIKSLSALQEPQSDEPEAFLWAGRLAHYKQPLEFVELARAVPEAQFWLVGVPVPPSPRQADVGQAVAEASEGLTNLHVLPPMPQSEIAGLLARAVASVNTCDFEGMPNTLLEAWSRGVPALALSHDPDGVIVEHGLGGFARGSRDELIRLAREQWATRTDRSEVAARCRRYIAENHSPEVIAVQWREPLGLGRPDERQSVASPEGKLACVG